MNRHDDTIVHAGTVGAPRFYEGISYSKDDFRFHIKNYTYMTGKGPVAGLVCSVMFTIDRPANQVWPHLKDFNRWQGSLGVHYTGVLGDMYTSEEHEIGRERVQLMLRSKESGILNDESYKTAMNRIVLRVIPEHLIVLFGPIPADGSNGGVAEGFDTFTLNEHAGKTIVTGHMEHGGRGIAKTEEQALAESVWGPRRYDMSASLGRWRDVLVPTLKALVTS